MLHARIVTRSAKPSPTAWCGPAIAFCAASASNRITGRSGVPTAPVSRAVQVPARHRRGPRPRRRRGAAPCSPLPQRRRHPTPPPASWRRRWRRARPRDTRGPSPGDTRAAPRTRAVAAADAAAPLGDQRRDHPDAIGHEIAPREHAAHACHLGRRRRVDRHHVGVGVRQAHERRVGLTRRVEVGVTALTRQATIVLTPPDRRTETERDHGLQNSRHRERGRPPAGRYSGGYPRGGREDPASPPLWRACSAQLHPGRARPAADTGHFTSREYAWSPTGSAGRGVNVQATVRPSVRAPNCSVF
jgi:hypothetical protein